MAEHDINLVTAQAGTVVAENLKVTLGTAGAGSLSPATITAMVGIAKNQSLKIADDVQSSMSILSSIAASNSSANTAAAATLTSMQSLQSSLGFGGSPNQAGFGSILQQAVQHCKDSVQLKQCTNFLESVDYQSFGSGITDMGSMASRGLDSAMGSLSSAGAAMAATGSMFNGIDVKDFGSPLGLVKSLQANKLANATGVNAKLAEAGVPLSDLDNPIYADKISQVMNNIKDPATLNIVAEQFNMSSVKLPSYNGNEGSLYKTPSFLGGESTNTSDFVEGSVTQGVSTASTSIGASIAPTVGSAGIQSLKDLSDPSKLLPPGDIAGFAGAGTLAQKFKDMGAGTIANAEAAASFFGSIKTAATPVMSSAYSSLNSLMSSLKPDIDNMIGSGTGTDGLPTVVDFTQHVSGGPAINSFLSAVQAQSGNLDAVDVSTVSSLADSVTSAQGLIAKAGIDLTSTPTSSLGTAMAFATNLKKFGQDTLTGVGSVLQNMADTSTQWGESVKASLAEGFNDKLLASNGIPPLNSNPYSGTPNDPTSNPQGNAAKLLGG